MALFSIFFGCIAESACMTFGNAAFCTSPVSVTTPSFTLAVSVGYSLSAAVTFVLRESSPEMITGAGGGGFLLFYSNDKVRLRHAMNDAGLQEVRFRFDFQGSAVIAQS